MSEGGKKKKKNLFVPKTTAETLTRGAAGRTRNGTTIEPRGRSTDLTCGRKLTGFGLPLLLLLLMFKFATFPLIDKG